MCLVYLSVAIGVTMITQHQWIEYFKYLDDLRASGEINMFGATSYLLEEFPDLDKWTGKKIVITWMQTFSDKSVEERVNMINDFD